MKGRITKGQEMTESQMVKEIWAEFYRVIVGLRKNFRVVMNLSVFFSEKSQILLCFFFRVFFLILKKSANESFGLLIFDLMSYSAF
jgi:hypothetical protein